jgi:hypothetical protein
LEAECGNQQQATNAQTSDSNPGHAYERQTAIPSQGTKGLCDTSAWSLAKILDDGKFFANTTRYFVALMGD